MKIRPPSTPAVHRIGRSKIEYRVTRHTNRLASTFIDWQSRYIRRLGDQTPGELWCLGIVLTMAVVERADLAGIAASGVTYQSCDGPTLEWLRPDGRRGARLLSRLAALALGDDGDPRAGGRLIEILAQGLRKLDPSLETSTDPVEAALLCSEAWCFTTLHQHLFAHVCGNLPMTPLRRPTFARLSSKLALTTAFDLILGDEEDAVGALDCFFHSAGDDKNSSTLTTILEDTHLRDIELKTDEQLRRDLAAGWRLRIDEAERAGPLTSLQLGCALHLAAKGEHKPATIIGYIKAGMPMVHEALSGTQLESLSSEELSTRLAGALERLEGQTRINARAYLGHLWRWALEWIDVEPLIPSLLPDVDVPEVDANVIWPHEGATMDMWLDRPDQPGPDLTRNTKLARGLMAALKMRPAEVFFLQARNVHVLDDKPYVEVEIMRRGRLHGLKTEDGQRMGKVTGPLAAQLLAQVNLRLIEHGAVDTHLLFGTKAQPNRVYRLAAMYSWLHRACKQVTGDPSSCCYHFRHYSVDSDYARMSLADIDAGMLEQLRVDTGHSDLESTQRAYMHRFARILRDAVEEELRRLKMSAASAALWTDLSAASTRQALARERSRAWLSGEFQARPELSSSSAWHWNIVQTRADAVTFPDAADGIALCCPLPPRALAAPRHWSVLDMLDFLDDLQHGDTPEQARRQRRLSEEVASTTVAHLLALGNQHLRDSDQPLDLQLTQPAAALAELDVRMVTAYQPKYGDWLAELGRRPPPLVSEAVEQAWVRATRGHYIKLVAALRPDRWLSFILEQGFAASKMRFCESRQHLTKLAEERRMIRVALAHVKAGVLSAKFEVTSYNDHRSRCYLLIADEADVLTNHTGAAFAPGGLKAIMLAMRLSSVAMARPEGGVK